MAEAISTSAPLGTRAWRWVLVPIVVGALVSLTAGAQKFTPGKDNPAKLAYGQSITDACIGWDASVGVLQGLSEAVKARRA